MRKIKTIDDITKDGKVEFGEGYEFVGTAEEADAILMRSTDLHGYELPEGIRAIARCGAASTTSPSRSTPRRASSSSTPPVPTATPSRSSSWACWCSRAAAWCNR